MLRQVAAVAGKGSDLAGRIIAAGKIDDLLLTLQATKSGHYQWVSSPFFLDLALRKPTVA